VNAKTIVRLTRTHRRAGKTDWTRVDALSDRQIEDAIKTDKDAAPILDKSWFKQAKLVMPERKTPERSRGLDGRHRDEDGEIRRRNGNTLVRTLREEYGNDFARGYRSDMKLENLLQRERASSLSELLRRKR
jgi:hypothetical protein